MAFSTTFVQAPVVRGTRVQSRAARCVAPVVRCQQQFMGAQEPAAVARAAAHVACKAGMLLLLWEGVIARVE